MTDTDTHAAQRVREAVAALNAAVADAERVGLTVEIDPRAEMPLALNGYGETYRPAGSLVAVTINRPL
jgi:hypothetical protein